MTFGGKLAKTLERDYRSVVKANGQYRQAFPSTYHVPGTVLSVSPHLHAMWWVRFLCTFYNGRNWGLKLSIKAGSVQRWEETFNGWEWRLREVKRLPWIAEHEGSSSAHSLQTLSCRASPHPCPSLSQIWVTGSRQPQEGNASLTEAIA